MSAKIAFGGDTLVVTNYTLPADKNFDIVNSASTGDVNVKLGSADGSASFRVKNSSASDVFLLDSAGNLTVAGNLTISGSTTTISSTTVQVVDSLFSLASNNPSNVVDLGWYGKYNDGTDRYSGIFWDASSSKFRMFANTTEAPGSTVNVAGTGYAVGTLIATLEGTGDCSVSGSLTVDNVAIDGNNVGLVSDTDLIELSENNVRINGTLTTNYLVPIDGINLPDNVAVNFGDGTDLSLVHNGTDNVLTSTTGNLNIVNSNATGATQFKLGTNTSATSFKVTNNSDSALLTVNGAGAVSLATSLAVGSALSATSSSLKLSDDIHGYYGNSNDLEIYHDGSAHHSYFRHTNASGNLVIGTSGAGDVHLNLATNDGSSSIRFYNSDSSVVFSVDSSGTAQVSSDLQVSNNIYGNLVTPAKGEINALSSGTYNVVTSNSNQTLTTAHVLGGVLVRASSGNNVTDTLPTAAALVAAAGVHAAEGYSFTLVVAKDTGNLTLSAGSGGSVVGNVTSKVNSNNNAIFMITLTNITASSEAYIVVPIAKIHD